MGIFAEDAQVGIVTGLRAEAKAIGKAPRLSCGLSTASPARAREAAEKLIADGATVLGSVGIAAGLHPEYSPGTIIVARQVIPWEGPLPASARRPPRIQDLGRLIRPGAEDEEAAAEEPRSCPERLVVSSLVDGLSAALGERAITGSIIGLDEPVASPDQKLALMSKTSAEAADMESHVVAEVAEGARIPWFVVRVIADPSNRRVPPAALAAVSPEGDVSVGRVVKGLMRHPADLPELISLSFDTASAMSALRRLGKILRQELG